MLSRFASSRVAAPVVAQTVCSRVGLRDAAPMSTFVRANISRMLSSNPSRIVDKSHEEELKKGRTTSGERLANINTPDSVADPARAAARQETDALGPEDRDMASRIRDAVGKSQGTYVGPTDRHPEFNIGPTKEQIQMANDRMKEQMTPADESTDQMNQQQKTLGGNPWQAGQQKGLVPEPAMKGEIGKEKGQQVSAKVQEAWDRTDPARKAEEMKATMKDEPIDWKHIQPGTRHLQGTKDNFDDDPAVSIDQMADAAKSVKDTVASSTVGQMVQDAKQAIKESPMRKEAKEAIKSTTVGHALKDMKDAVKTTMRDAKVNIKEFVTGEREVEKPDESKSEVRTTRGTYRRGDQQKHASTEDRQKQQRQQ